MRYSVSSILFLVVFLMGSNPVMAQSNNDSTSFEWYNLEEAQKRAESEQKKVFIFAEAEWCGICKQMKREVFPKEEVQQIITEYFYPVKIDIESDNNIVFNGDKMTEQNFSRNMRVSATPTMIFVDHKGEVLGVQPGFIEESVFTSLLEYIGNNRMGEGDFEDYLERKGK